MLQHLDNPIGLGLRIPHRRSDTGHHIKSRAFLQYRDFGSSLS
jgi:hypothetical protein